MKVTLVILVFFFASVAASGQWIRQTVDTKASFRGLSAVNEKIVWASGTGGAVIRTIDGGKTWKVMAVPGAEKLDFRDIEAFDAKTAYILSIGNGESSRIYKTIDGGAIWRNQFTNKNEKAFFDAIACWDAKNCIAMSDPVDGKYVLIETADGEAWKPLDTSRMPTAKEGEAAFAASGTCLITQGKNNAFLVTGGNDARVFRTRDRGKTWQVSETPITKGTAGSGVFSIAMFDDKIGVIVGGNYEMPEERNDTFAMTQDGGEHWSIGARPNGYRSSVVYADRRIVIAAGTNGADVSFDRGLLWEKLGSENLNAIAARGVDAVWAVGPNGIVLHLNPSALSGRSFDSNSDVVTHPPNVNVLNLSHVEISTDCNVSNTGCSSKRRINVAVAAHEHAGPHEFVYRITAGKIIGDGPNIEWDLSNIKPGTYTITVGIRLPYFRGTRWGVLGQTKTREVVVR